MAEMAGLCAKPLYTVMEVSRASGISKRTIYDEISAGRLTAFLPGGRRQGKLIAPEWFDEWFQSGIRRANE